jgi:hypothetical protein
MKTNRLLLFLALALMAALLSACGGSPVATTWPGLAASEEAAYLANGSVIYAVRLSDGEELWRFPEKPRLHLRWKFAGRFQRRRPHLLPCGCPDR